VIQNSLSSIDLDGKLNQLDLAVICLTIIVTTLLVQLIKTILQAYKTKKLNWSVFFSTGGMPSSHSALVASACSLLWVANSFQLSIPFIVALVIAIVVIHDAMGIRLEASKHAKLLNEMTRKLNLDSEEYSEKQLKELLGHRPIEVLVGVFIGVIIPILVWVIYRGGNIW
jgi:acid phosphatase family membrane protein YuiD